ncbi:YbjN domain-containing protein [Deinococcus yavapaiensis]|nr:YbjN domain-containing protein [Deinococcus yavapaiensis]
MKKTLMLVTLSALSATPAFAAATVYEAKPESIMTILKAEGYKPEYKAGDEKTKPSITVKLAGDNYYFYFTGCKNGVCQRINADNGFEKPDKADGLAEKLAKWNAEWYSQAYQEKDGTIYLDSSYIITGGFTAENFLAWLDSYTNDFDEFYKNLYAK